MRPKRAIKDLEKQLRKDSENLVLRLKLAAVYREVGRLEDAVALYRSVAVAYHSQNRLVQALAVCRSVLEIDPTQRETQVLLEELNRMRGAQAAAAATPATPATPADQPGEPGEVPPAENSIPSLAKTSRRRRPSTGGLGRTESSGMRIPLQSPQTPPMGSLPPAKYAGGAKRPEPPAKPGRRGHTSTQRMSRPPEQVARPSQSLLTPTPLPQPLALHDAELQLERPAHRGPRPLPKNLPHAANMGDEEPTRIAPDVLAAGPPSSLSPKTVRPAQMEDDARTTVADELGLLPSMVREPPRLPTPLPMEPASRAPIAPLPLDVARPPAVPRAPAQPRPAQPRPAQPRPAQPRPPIRAQPTFFEQETRLVMSMDEEVMLDDEADDSLDDDLPTNPGVDEDALTPPPADIDEFPEEPTNPRDDSANASTKRVTKPHASQGGNRATDLDLRGPLLATRESVDGLSMDQAFDRSFSGTIRSLAPDGAAIDTPLTLFSDLPEEALIEMSNRMVIRSFAPGDLVIREGDPGDACFVVAVGEVRVLKRNPIEPHGDLVEVARLGQGALFGEFALLADRRRHATVQAVQACELYEIPRKLLRELAASYVDVGPVLENFYRERLLATLLATAPFFKPLQEEHRAQLLSRFKPMRAESGERIISEGQKAGGLYLIVLGSVEILKRVSDKRMVLLATLGEGSYFGEMSLLKGGVASASVIATGPTELAVMPPRDFYEIVADNPVLWDEVRREANRRQLEMNQIVTGETNVV